MPYHYTHQQTLNILRIAQSAHFIRFQKALIFKSPANQNALDALKQFCLSLNWEDKDETLIIALNQFVENSPILITELEWGDLCKDVVQNGCIFNIYNTFDALAFIAFTNNLISLFHLYLKSPAKDSSSSIFEMAEMFWGQFMNQLCHSPHSHAGEILHRFIYLAHQIATHEATTKMNLQRVSPPTAGCLINSLKLDDYILGERNTLETMSKLSIFMGHFTQKLLLSNMVQVPYQSNLYEQFTLSEESRSQAAEKLWQLGVSASINSLKPAILISPRNGLSSSSSIIPISGENPRCHPVQRFSSHDPISTLPYSHQSNTTTPRKELSPPESKNAFLLTLPNPVLFSQPLVSTPHPKEPRHPKKGHLFSSKRKTASDKEDPVQIIEIQPEEVAKGKFNFPKPFE